MTNAVDDLYEQDFYTWTRRQAEALRRAAKERVNTTDPIDWAHVAEEIEDMGREQASKLRSSYRLILAHLLKWRYQPLPQSASWRITINRERRNVSLHLADNPGLKPRRHALFTAAYAVARRDAADESGLPLRTFSEACPFTLAEVLDEEFWPIGD